MSAIEGLDELVNALDDLPEKLMAALADGLDEGLMRTAELARQLCPGDNGELRDSIESRVVRKGETIDGQVSASAPYAVRVEMGGGPKGPPARPFLYPAYKQTRGAIAEDMAQAVNERLEER